MHLLSTRPGGYVDDGGQGVVRVDNRALHEKITARIRVFQTHVAM